MLYHQEPHLPVDIELIPDKKSGDDIDIDDYITAMLSVRNNLGPVAMKNIKRSQKDYYDKKHGCQVIHAWIIV